MKGMAPVADAQLDQMGIGNRLAPPRFILFAVIAMIATPVAIIASDWRTVSFFSRMNPVLGTASCVKFPPASNCPSA